MLVIKTEWREEEHPRDERGRFTEKPDAPKEPTPAEAASVEEQPSWIADRSPQDRETFQRAVAVRARLMAETADIIPQAIREAREAHQALRARVESRLLDIGLDSARIDALIAHANEVLRGPISDDVRYIAEAQVEFEQEKEWRMPAPIMPGQYDEHHIASTFVLLDFLKALRNGDTAAWSALQQYMRPLALANMYKTTQAEDRAALDKIAWHAKRPSLLNVQERTQFLTQLLPAYGGLHAIAMRYGLCSERALTSFVMDDVRGYVEANDYFTIRKTPYAGDSPLRWCLDSKIRSLLFSWDDTGEAKVRELTGDERKQLVTELAGRARRLITFFEGIASSEEERAALQAFRSMWESAEADPDGASLDELFLSVSGMTRQECADRLTQDWKGRIVPAVRAMLDPNNGLLESAMRDLVGDLVIEVASADYSTGSELERQLRERATDWDAVAAQADGPLKAHIEVLRRALRPEEVADGKPLFGLVSIASFVASDLAKDVVDLRQPDNRRRAAYLRAIIGLSGLRMSTGSITNGLVGLLEPIPDRPPLFSSDEPGFRLFDWRNWKLLAREIQSRIATKLGRRLGLSESEMDDAVTAVWRAWVHDIDEPHTHALRAAVAEDFGLTTAGPETSAQRLEEVLGDRRKALAWRTAMLASWATTQHLMQMAGIKTVQVYRALFLPENQVGRARRVRVKYPAGGGTVAFELPDVQLQRAALQSFTVDEMVANTWRFGERPGHVRVVVRAEVPAEAVVSLPVYGKNAFGEQELVVLGLPWLWWDAWREDAPSLRDSPPRRKTRKAEWREEEHPRDERGRFTEKPDAPEEPKPPEQDRVAVEEEYPWLAERSEQDRKMFSNMLELRYRIAGDVESVVNRVLGGVAQARDRLRADLSALLSEQGLDPKIAGVLVDRLARLVMSDDEKLSLGQAVAAISHLEKYKKTDRLHPPREVIDSLVALSAMRSIANGDAAGISLLENNKASLLKNYFYSNPLTLQGAKDILALVREVPADTEKHVAILSERVTGFREALHLVRQFGLCSDQELVSYTVKRLKECVTTMNPQRLFQGWLGYLSKLAPVENYLSFTGSGGLIEAKPGQPVRVIDDNPTMVGKLLSMMDTVENAFASAREFPGANEKIAEIRREIESILQEKRYDAIGGMMAKLIGVSPQEYADRLTRAWDEEILPAIRDVLNPERGLLDKIARNVFAEAIKKSADKWQMSSVRYNPPVERWLDFDKQIEAQADETLKRSIEIVRKVFYDQFRSYSGVFGLLGAMRDLTFSKANLFYNQANKKESAAKQKLAYISSVLHAVVAYAANGSLDEASSAIPVLTDEKPPLFGGGKSSAPQTRAQWFRWKKIANHIQSELAVHLGSKLGLSAEEMRQALRDVWRAWVHDIGDPHTNALRAAVAEDFGLVKAGPEVGAKKLGEVLKDERKALAWRTAMLASWATTQYLLRLAGIKTVEGYRAVFLKPSRATDEYHEQVSVPRSGQHSEEYARLPKVKVKRAALQSFSKNVRVPNEWGYGSEDLTDVRVVLRAEVPAEAVISLPVYGKNAFGEQEFVVLGLPWLWWDAWFKRAPALTQVPPPTKKPKTRRSQSRPTAAKAEWREEDHPRDERGRFTNKPDAPEKPKPPETPDVDETPEWIAGRDEQDRRMLREALVLRKQLLADTDDVVRDVIRTQANIWARFIEKNHGFSSADRGFLLRIAKWAADCLATGEVTEEHWRLSEWYKAGEERQRPDVDALNARLVDTIAAFDVLRRVAEGDEKMTWRLLIGHGNALFFRLRAAHVLDPTIRDRARSLIGVYEKVDDAGTPEERLRVLTDQLPGFAAMRRLAAQIGVSDERCVEWAVEKLSEFARLNIMPDELSWLLHCDEQALYLAPNVFSRLFRESSGDTERGERPETGIHLVQGERETLLQQIELLRDVAYDNVRNILNSLAQNNDQRERAKQFLTQWLKDAQRAFAMRQRPGRYRNAEPPSSKALECLMPTSASAFAERMDRYVRERMAPAAQRVIRELLPVFLRAVAEGKVETLVDINVDFASIGDKYLGDLKDTNFDKYRSLREDLRVLRGGYALHEIDFDVMRDLHHGAANIISTMRLRAPERFKPLGNIMLGLRNLFEGALRTGTPIAQLARETLGIDPGRPMLFSAQERGEENIKDWKRWKVLANAMQSEIAAHLGGKLGFSAKEMRQALRDVWRAWVHDINEPQTHALRAAMAEDLGIVRAGPEAGAQRLEEVLGDRRKALAWRTAMIASWVTTQHLLRLGGYEAMPAYRAMYTSVTDDDRREVQTVEDREYTRLPERQIMRAALQSFTTDERVANEWTYGASLEGRDRIVLRAMIPPEAIISVPVYGRNEFGEQELIVLGIPWIAWDVWLSEAPRIDDVPLLGAKKKKSKKHDIATQIDFLPPGQLCFGFAA